ncbi:hypothetical protein H4Q32_023183 [Labeo rohita]|uniref:Uncharacterized protein n=1 Tax=Labeo rohita TaxID=84645 RepID=A0ABQ8M9W2_LABRO|nr:hypothetical protein H4Q32_023183 [Labeo rohita]
MEGVLEVVLRLCVCKLMSSVVLCSSVVTHTITAVSLCCSCLLLFTDLAAYGVVLLLMPPLIAVELLVDLLHSQDGQTKRRDAREQDASESLSSSIGYFGCLLAWSLSGIYSSHDWTLEHIAVETCREKGGHLLACLPHADEFSLVLPAMVVLLSLTGSLGLFRTKASRRQSDSFENTQIVPGLMHMSSTLVDSEKTPDSCDVHMAGFVYDEPRWLCPGNGGVLCAQQTGLADNIEKQKQSFSHATFAQSKIDLLLDVTLVEVKTGQRVFNRTDLKSQSRRCRFPKRESPCWGREIFTGLVCVVMVCVFPTVVSSNILLIFNLENLVAYSLKLLSLSANRAPDL